MSSNLTNIEIVVYAVYRLEGISERVHTEDVAIKCFELAPDSFSWTKYPQYPDKEVVRFALEDAQKKRGGMLVQGRSKKKHPIGKAMPIPAPAGWMLTSAGASWIAENAARIEERLNLRQPNIQRQEIQRKLANFRNHALFQSYVRQPEFFKPSIGDIAEYYRCRVDADRAVWEKRFESVKNIAATLNETTLLTFVEKCRQIVESQIGS